MAGYLGRNYAAPVGYGNTGTQVQILPYYPKFTPYAEVKECKAHDFASVLEGKGVIPLDTDMSNGPAVYVNRIVSEYSNVGQQRPLPGRQLALTVRTTDPEYEGHTPVVCDIDRIDFLAIEEAGGGGRVRDILDFRNLLSIWHDPNNVSSDFLEGIAAHSGDLSAVPRDVIQKPGHCRFAVAGETSHDADSEDSSDGTKTTFNNTDGRSALMSTTISRLNTHSCYEFSATDFVYAVIPTAEDLQKSRKLNPGGMDIYAGITTPFMLVPAPVFDHYLENVYHIEDQALRQDFIRSLYVGKAISPSKNGFVSIANKQ